MTSWRDKTARHRTEDGFTLTEILITVVILGILAAIAVPMYNAQREKADDATLKSNMLSAMNNLFQAKTAFGGLFPSTVVPVGKPAIIASTVDGLSFNYTVPYNRQNFCLQGDYKGDTLFITAEKKLSTSDCTYTYVVPAPANFSAQVTTNFKPTARWDAIEDATSYNVYKDGVKVLTTSTNNATLPTMTPSSTGLYWVRGVVAGKETADSNKVSLTAPVPAPSTAPVLSYTETSKNGPAMTTANRISWTAVQYSTKYTLYDSDTNELIYAGSATSANVTVEINDTKRYYVIASNDTGIGPKSNIITIAPKFATPLLNIKTDDFTLEAIFSWQDMVSTYGTGSKAVLRKGPLGFIDGPNTFSTTSNTVKNTFSSRMPSTWTLEITTGNGVVLTSAPVTMSFTPLPFVTPVYNQNTQNIESTLKNTPIDFGLNGTNSTWSLQVSDTLTFAKIYPQSSQTSFSPSATFVDKPSPTHGDTYYIRYVINRKSDGAQLTSVVKSLTVPTRMMDVKNDGNRDMLVLSTWQNVGQILITPTNTSGWGMRADIPIRDPRYIGNDCVVEPVQDLYGPGSKGFFCVRHQTGGLYPGSLDYYPINEDGTIGAVKFIGDGWNMYEKTTVVQNFYGDDYPSLIAIRFDGGLEVWRGGPNGLIGVDRNGGSGWHPAASNITAVTGIYDWNGTGTIGIMATLRSSPWHIYYPLTKQASQPANKQWGPNVRLNASWETVAPNPIYPTDARPNGCCSHVYARGYGNASINGKILPVLGFGPQGYYDAFYGNGAGSFAGSGLNVGYNNDNYRGYPGQWSPIR